MFVSFSIIYTFTINQGGFPSFFYIDGINRDIEALIQTIWGIQVSLSLVSISLVSIVVGKMDKKLYGLKLSEVLGIQKRSYFRLTYFERISLVVILAVLNIFSVIYIVLPATMLLFLINFWLLGDILFQTYDLLTNEEKYFKLCKDYLQLEMQLKVDNKKSQFIKLLKNILEDTQIAIQMGNILIIQENLDCLSALIEQLIKTENSDLLLKEILSVHEELTKLLLKRHFHELYINNLKRFIKLKIENSKIISHFIVIQVDNLSQFCQESLNELEYKEILNFLSIDLLLEDNLSTIITPKDMSDYLVRAYYGRYEGVLKNRQDDKVLNEFYRWIMISEFEKSDDYISDVKYNLLLRLFKLLFDLDDVGTFTTVLRELYQRNSFSLVQGRFDNEKVYLILLQLNIYCYYGISKEDYFTNITKNQIESFLLAVDNNRTKEIFNLIKFVSLIDYRCWSYYEILTKNLSSWEYMPQGEAKWMCMESAILEFYFCYTICFVPNYQFQKIYDLFIDKEGLFEILNFYNQDGTLKASIESRLQKYNQIYVQTAPINYDAINEFYQFLCYKKVLQEINKEKSYSHDVQMEIYRKKLIEKFNNLLNKNSTFYKINNEWDNQLKTIPFKTAFLVPNSVLTEKITLVGRSFEQIMLERFNSFVIHHLKQSLLDYTIYSSEMEKSKKLLRVFDSHNLTPTVRLNQSPLENWFFNSTESDEEINTFKNFEDSLTSLDNFLSDGSTYYLKF